MYKLQDFQHPGFIKDALKSRILHLKPTDFTTTEYKKELQYLFQLMYFPDYDFINNAVTNIDERVLNKQIDILRRQNLKNFNTVLRYPVSTGGFGPGEVLLFLLTKETRLGGMRSAGADLITDRYKYEIKTVRVSSDNYVSNFKLGGKVENEVEVITELVKLCKANNLTATSNSIPVNSIKELKRKANKEFNLIENMYRDAAIKYFTGTSTIFMYNNETVKSGSIAGIKKAVNLNDINIQVVSEGKIKPSIKL